MSKLYSTTALICVTWLSALLTPVSAADLSRDRNNHRDEFSDNNKEFLCHYGFEVDDRYNWISHSSSNFASRYQSAATPIMGQGTTVSEIVVAEAPRRKGSFKFRVSLYNDHDGEPGGEMAGASAAPTTKHCQLVTVTITPTLLTQGQPYWVVESAQQNSKRGSSGGKWLFDVDDHHTSRRALKRGGFYCCCSLCDTGTSYGWSDVSSTAERLYAKVK